MKKLDPLIHLLVILGIISATACGQGTPPSPTLQNPTPSNPTPSKDQVTIHFACPPGFESDFQSLADEFNAQNPSISVAVISVPYPTSATPMDDRPLKVVSTADTLYDNIDPMDAARGLYLDLTPLIDADPNFHPEDFFPHMLEAFSSGGKTWGLPTQADMAFLVYDKSIFDQDKVKYHSINWMPGDFLDTANRLTHPSGDKNQYGFVDFWFVANLAFVGDTINQSIQNQRIDTDEIASVVSWYTNLALKYHVMPPILSGNPAIDQAQRLVEGKQAAMWSDAFHNTLNSLGEQKRNVPGARNLGIAPFPTGRGDVVPANMPGYAISAGTQHPSEAWAWLDFLTHHQRIGSVDINGIPMFGDELPARESVADSNHYWDLFEGDTAEMVRFASQHLVFHAFDPAHAQSWVSLAEVSICAGKQSVKEALADAQAAYQKALDQVAAIQPVQVIVGSEASPGAGEQVSFSAYGPEMAALTQLAGAFNQQNSSISINIVSRTNGSADCSFETGIPGNAKNLQPLLDADSSFSTAAFYPAMLDAFRSQGNLMGIPLQAQARLIDYNPDLFDAAGIPYPDPTWTLQDFLSTATALTQTKNGQPQYGFLSLNGEAGDLLDFVALQGVSLWDISGKPAFTQPDAIAAVQWFLDLALKSKVMPLFKSDQATVDQASVDARNALVHDGQVAMWTDFSGIDRTNLWPNNKVKAVPLPSGSAKVTDFIYQGLFISDSTQHANACWDWIKYVSANSALFKGLLARQDVFNLPAFQGQMDKEEYETDRILLEEYRDLNAFEKVNPSQLPFLDQAVTSILNGVPVDAALTSAQQKAEQ